MDSFLALDEARRRPAAGPEALSQGLVRFQSMFADFSEARVREIAPAAYAEALWFNDALKTLRSRDALVPYLAESAAATEACRVETAQAQPCGEGELLLRWKMMIRFRRFQRGRDTWSIGVSHLRFDADGRIDYHQDYWNAADGLFRHIPVVGGLIRWIQGRL